MDSLEPQPPQPHPHHLHLENIVLVDPNPFTNIVPTTLMELSTAQLHQFNMNTNQPSHFEPFNNNNVLSTLNPCVGASSGSGSIKKKRGRSRKYFTYDNIAFFLDSCHDATITSPSSSTMKKNTRGRGRPRGSLNKKKKVQKPRVTGSGFCPYLITVNPGENIVAKLKTCCQGGPNTDMCILSAHGLVGTVSLHQTGSIVTYAGQFELVSMSGMLEVFDNNKGSKRMSNFKVTLVDPDSHLLEGEVADTLIAASSVKVTVGSFALDGKKGSSNNLKIGSSSVPSSQFDTSKTSTSATFQGPSYKFHGNNENSPCNQRLGIYNNDSNPIPTILAFHQMLAHQKQQ